MKVKKRILLIFLVLVGIALAGCFGMFQISKQGGILRPYRPKPGEKTILEVIAFNEETRSPLQIEVTLVDLETQKS
ncbi:MAG: hypothetical protein QXL09_03025 [Candidatus Aenigmatarchaeota archaeon]